MELNHIELPPQPKISELVMHAIEEGLDSGKLRVGEELPSERDFAAALGVSRAPLRECLAILSFLGVLENRGNRKIIVRDASYLRRAMGIVQFSSAFEVQDDVIEFRRVNETAIVSLACDRAMREDLDRIRDALDRLRDDLYDDEADVDFHMELARASHNSMFIVMMELFKTIIRDVRLQYSRLPNYYLRTYNSHRRIYEAICARDRATASEEIAHHVELVRSFQREAAKLATDEAV